MAVMVQLSCFNGSQVRVEGAVGWEEEDGRLLVTGPEERTGPTQTFVGVTVEPSRTPILAEFATGMWVYVRHVPDDQPAG